MFVSRHQAMEPEEFEAASKDSGVKCDPLEDMARPEFKDEADVNVMLRRFGAGVPLRPVHYGELDTDLDLAGAFQQVEQAKEAYEGLPDSIKGVYKSWQAFAAAWEAGQITLHPSEPAPAGGSAGAGAEATSEARQAVS